MQIIQIKDIDKKRIRIRLEDGYEFALYKGECRRYHLQEEADLSEGQLLEIREEILIKRARKRVMHLLERMDRTESQLRTKLKQGCYPEDVIEDAIGYVKGCHYLDDLRYAGNYVRCHKNRKSRKMLQRELLARGISKEQIARALEEECPQDNEREKILTWIQKKNYSSQTADMKEKQRMYQFLVRRGFCPNDILHVLDYLT